MQEGQLFVPVIAVLFHMKIDVAELLLVFVRERGVSPLLTLPVNSRETLSAASGMPFLRLNSTIGRYRAQL